MPLTDAYGKTEAKDLPLGLYAVVTTSVPETVTSSTAPFLVSLPFLEKTIKETTADTGKTVAYAHTATASSGDNALDAPKPRGYER